MNSTALNLDPITVPVRLTVVATDQERDEIEHLRDEVDSLHLEMDRLLDERAEMLDEIDMLYAQVVSVLRTGTATERAKSDATVKTEPRRRGHLRLVTDDYVPDEEPSQAMWRETCGGCEPSGRISSEPLAEWERDLIDGRGDY